MTRLLSIGGLLLVGLALGSLPVRAEYMREEVGTFYGSGQSERANGRTASRPSARAGRTTRQATRAARRSTPGVGQQRRAPARQAALPSLSGGSSQSGVASYYWQPQRVASGGWFNPNAMTAAHKTLPFGTRVRVTSMATGRSVVVTINDRGPYVRGRIIDLSRAAAGVIGMQGSGIARVQVAVLGR